MGIERVACFNNGIERVVYCKNDIERITKIAKDTIKFKMEPQHEIVSGFVNVRKQLFVVVFFWFLFFFIHIKSYN